MRQPPGSSNGFALALVLWLVALLAMMALSLGAMQRSETSAAAAVSEGARARAAAQAGIQLAILDLMRVPAARRLTLDGQPYATYYDDVLLQISAIDEAGKVDLNFASAPLLDELLHAAGVEAELERSRLVDAILDWRDSDDLRRVHGAERDEYQAAGASYAPRNAAFQSIEELSLVLGMGAPLYHRIAGSITIFGGASGIDGAAAVLERLSLSAAQDEEGEALSIEGEENRSAAGVSRAAQVGRAVTLRCAAQLPGDVRATLEAVVRFTPRRGNLPPHHEVVLWREVPAVAEADAAAIWGVNPLVGK